MSDIKEKRIRKKKKKKKKERNLVYWKYAEN